MLTIPVVAGDPKPFKLGIDLMWLWETPDGAQTQRCMRTLMRRHVYRRSHFASPVRQHKRLLQYHHDMPLR